MAFPPTISTAVSTALNTTESLKIAFPAINIATWSKLRLTKFETKKFPPLISI